MQLQTCRLRKVISWPRVWRLSKSHHMSASIDVAGSTRSNVQRCQARKCTAPLLNFVPHALAIFSVCRCLCAGVASGACVEYVNNGFLRITGKGQTSFCICNSQQMVLPGRPAGAGGWACPQWCSAVQARPETQKTYFPVSSDQCKIRRSHICAGYQREEVIGQKAGTFLAGIGTDPQALEALDQAAAKGQDRTIELLHYKRNGSAFCDQVRLQRGTAHVLAVAPCLALHDQGQRGMRSGRLGNLRHLDAQVLQGIITGRSTCRIAKASLSLSTPRAF